MTIKLGQKLTVTQEEHPPIISNFGMGSALVNYYRKKDEKEAPFEEQ